MITCTLSRAVTDIIDGVTLFLIILLQKYQWINLQNIYYKDKKFSIEIYTTSK